MKKYLLMALLAFLLSGYAEKAAAAELPVLSHQLRAYLGEALAKEGDLRRADTETRKAIDGLAQERHTPLLGEACA